MSGRDEDVMVPSEPSSSVESHPVHLTDQAQVIDVVHKSRDAVVRILRGTQGYPLHGSGERA